MRQPAPSIERQRRVEGRSQGHRRPISSSSVLAGERGRKPARDRRPAPSSSRSGYFFGAAEEHRAVATLARERFRPWQARRRQGRAPPRQRQARPAHPAGRRASSFVKDECAGPAVTATRPRGPRRGPNSIRPGSRVGPPAIAFNVIERERRSPADEEYAPKTTRPAISLWRESLTLP